MSKTVTMLRCIAECDPMCPFHGKKHTAAWKAEWSDLYETNRKLESWEFGDHDGLCSCKLEALPAPAVPKAKEPKAAKRCPKCCMEKSVTGTCPMDCA